MFKKNENQQNTNLPVSLFYGLMALIIYYIVTLFVF